MIAGSAAATREKLRWQCRRGMLELDLLLNDYLADNFERLDDSELELFSKLLDYPDQVLLDLLLGQMQASDRGMAEFVNRIRVSRTCA